MAPDHDQTQAQNGRERVRGSALQVGLSLGLILVVVGLVNDNYGLLGFGVVIALAGYFSRKG